MVTVSDMTATRYSSLDAGNRGRVPRKHVRFGSICLGHWPRSTRRGLAEPRTTTNSMLVWNREMSFHVSNNIPAKSHFLVISIHTGVGSVKHLLTAVLFSPKHTNPKKD